MTLRCLEPSGNGADRTRSQWGTAGSAEEQSPEAARLAKALRELSQTGRKLAAGAECPERPGAFPKAVAGTAAGTRAQVGITEGDGTLSPLARSGLQSPGAAGRDARRLGGILGDDKSKVEGRWGSGGGLSASWAPWEWSLGAVTLGCFRPGFGLRRSGSHPRGRKAAGASLNAGRAGGQWAVLPLGWAACAPGLSRRRNPGRWQPSSETDSLRGAQLRDSMAQSSQQGPCPGRPPGTPCLGRHSVQCGSGSQHQKEKK